MNTSAGEVVVISTGD